ncbi:hypothetical protein [Sphingomonas xinjiangensis]|uniref:Uncharacterized protein n=1 Tax=Sphingomonas xinjiangensis TaxID=643568 RepID=A0A840YC14_9SPHN|nr:hypothetical protein [Sphingomonas xinjiangensis]MBB5710897.1 hypothetical protein [Sphingomonas xinjiangensis]
MNNFSSSPSATSSRTPRPRPAEPRGELRQTGSRPADPQPNHRRVFAEALSKHAGKGMAKELLKETGDGLAAIASSREFANAALTAQASPAGDIDAGLHAQLDRIAAAIAEVAKSGAQPEVHLSLPLGAYAVEGAVLGRDLAGRVNVTLIPNGAVPPTVAAQWSEQLSERLIRRELRVAKVGVQAMGRRSLPPA